MHRTLNEFFDLVVCLNLDRRADRWQVVRSRFDGLGIRARRMSAREGPVALEADPPHPHWGRRRAWIGCAMSHVAAVRTAKEEGRTSIFIFEDDVVFDPAFQVKLDAWLPEVPTDWDMLYLGGSHHDRPFHQGRQLSWDESAPVPVSEHVHRLRHDHCIHAYGVRDTLFDEVLSLEPATLPEPLDNVYAREFHARRNCYGLMPVSDARPGTWGIVQQDPALGSDIRDPEGPAAVRWGTDHGEAG